MPLVLAFTVTFGAVLLISSAIADASFSDVIRGKTRQDYDQNQQQTGSATAGATATATSSLNAPGKVNALLTAAQSVVGAPYKWGGGHQAGALARTAAQVKRDGVDCSGFVSYILGQAGIITSPQTTQTLPDTGGVATGPGRYVTIYDRTDGLDGGDHVIIDIAGHWFESGGNPSFNPSGNGGVSAIPKPPASYLSSFNTLLHPVGL